MSDRVVPCHYVHACQMDGGPAGTGRDEQRRSESSGSSQLPESLRQQPELASELEARARWPQCVPHWSAPRGGLPVTASWWRARIGIVQWHHWPRPAVAKMGASRPGARATGLPVAKCTVTGSLRERGAQYGVSPDHRDAGRT